jgi:hypothetical protein
MGKYLVTVLCVCVCVAASAQSKDDYSTGGQSQSNQQSNAVKSFLDPSRFTIHNGLSFGMISGSSSNIKSQSLYTTMMQYQFAAPVTVNLNFGLPIYSTLSSAQNLNKDNLQSLEYFKNMPWDVSLTWNPLKNMALRFSMVHQNYSPFQDYLMEPQYDLFGNRLPAPIAPNHK